MRATGTEGASRDLSCTKSCTHTIENQPLSALVSSHGLSGTVPGVKTESPHFLAENEGFCGPLSVVKEEPPLGFEPRTYALRKHRSAS